MAILDEEIELAPTREEIITARRDDATKRDTEAIFRAWGWLRHYGHQPPDLTRIHKMSLSELRDLLEREQRRVRLLAETWETWW